MKIGLLLGSFNPITVAHVTMASSVINSGLCDKVLFVVAKHNPWKKEEPAPFDLRCQMIEAAVRPLGDKCEVCRFEEKHEPPVYSFIPINEAIKAYPKDDICVIAGSDTIDRIPRWRNYNTEIKGKVSFIEITRGEQPIAKGLKTTPHPFVMDFYHNEKLGCNVGRLIVNRMDISSTMVRNMVNNGMNPYPFVTEEVNRIITENNLYK
jgi:nicotinate-nucleotide adenylyltransferase